MPDLRLISAEILELRRRYGLLAEARSMQTLGIAWWCSASPRSSTPVTPPATARPAARSTTSTLIGTLGFMAKSSG